MALLVALLVLGPRWLTPAPPPAEGVAPVDCRPRRERFARVCSTSNEDGTGLTGVEQEVMYGEGTVEQARRIVEAQLAAPARAALVGDSAGHDAPHGVSHERRRRVRRSERRAADRIIPGGRRTKF